MSALTRFCPRTIFILLYCGVVSLKTLDIPRKLSEKILNYMAWNGIKKGMAQNLKMHLALEFYYQRLLQGSKLLLRRGWRGLPAAM